MPSLTSQILLPFLRHANFFAFEVDAISQKREQVDSATWLLPMPRGVRVEPVKANSVPAEWVLPQNAPADRIILYIHGGAFVFCSRKTHRGLVARLARASSCRALSIDYRLAPEHPFPAALDDCAEAYEYLLANGFSPRQIVVAGDSAGGNLALALALHLRDKGKPLPAALVCLSPATDLTGQVDSRKSRAQRDPILSNKVIELVHPYIGSHDARDPLLSPLFGDFQGMPPILLHVGTEEILYDDSVLLAEKIRRSGGAATARIWPGMWHVFHIMAPLLPEASAAIRELADFIQVAFANEAKGA